MCSCRGTAQRAAVSDLRSKAPTVQTSVTRLAVALRRSRAVHLAHLRETIDVPLVYLPYLFVRDHGLRVTRMVAEHLASELGR